MDTQFKTERTSLNKKNKDFYGCVLEFLYIALQTTGSGRTENTWRGDSEDGLLKCSPA